MRRICPNCNNRLYNFDSYFCSTCTYKLDDNLVREAASFRVRKSKFIVEDSTVGTLEDFGNNIPKVNLKNFRIDVNSRGVKISLISFFIMSAVLLLFVSFKFYLDTAKPSKPETTKVVVEQKTYMNTIFSKKL